jgi:hypothetical protein
MQQRDGAINLILCGIIAGRGKVNLTQLLISPMLVLLRHSTRRKKDQQDSRDEFCPVPWF